MNKIDGAAGAVPTGRSYAGGKFYDRRRIIKLASNSFNKEKYPLAIDYCRTAVNSGNGRKELVADAYYIWCMSCLKMNNPQDARKVCYDARLKLGNYLDLIYFEIRIASLTGELDKIPRFAENYLELYYDAGGQFDPSREKSSEKIGEVLLLAGQVLEQKQEKAGAVDFYSKYLSIFPDNEPLRERVTELAP